MHYIFGNRRRIAIAVILGIGIVIALLGAVDRAKKALSGQQRPVAASQSQATKEIRDLQKIPKESASFGEENHSIPIKLPQKGPNYRGDLGGVTVQVPKSWAFLLSYDDAKNPETQEYIIKGFILRTNADWLISGKGDRERIGELMNRASIFVTAGVRPPSRELSMNYLSSPCVLGLRKNRYPYKKSPSEVHGLEWCYPEYEFKKSNEKLHDENIYYKNHDRVVTDVVICFNGVTGSSYCDHTFFLDHGPRAEISIRYHKIHLQNWKLIRDRVQSVFIDFAIPRPS
ncbi:hypothetical protein [Vandammella animalimorsus]|uniref:hypothetical protein n=1 Tax=Vandammella animalimorsus TaxID=2029117 RepID=UPI001177D60E|nr:hypothetical protein [Vandammella animalimorsus]